MKAVRLFYKLFYFVLQTPLAVVLSYHENNKHGMIFFRRVHKMYLKLDAICLLQELTVDVMVLFMQ